MPGTIDDKTKAAALNLPVALRNDLVGPILVGPVGGRNGLLGLARAGLMHLCVDFAGCRIVVGRGQGVWVRNHATILSVTNPALQKALTRSKIAVDRPARAKSQLYANFKPGVRAKTELRSCC